MVSPGLDPGASLGVIVVLVFVYLWMFLNTFRKD